MLVQTYHHKDNIVAPQETDYDDENHQFADDFDYPEHEEESGFAYKGHLVRTFCSSAMMAIITLLGITDMIFITAKLITLSGDISSFLPMMRLKIVIFLLIVTIMYKYPSLLNIEKID
jgi:hypothetical protein